MTMPLTDTFIRNAKPASKAKKYADGEGLFLFVTPKGVKSWRFRYRDVTGKEKEMTIGTYPEISLQEARGKRFDARKLLQQGKDPSIEKKERAIKAKYEATNTFEAVAKEWFNLNKDKWSEKYVIKVGNRLKKYVFPVLGNKPINNVNGLEILDIIRKIEEAGNTETSHKLFQNCVAIFQLAFLTQRVLFNPISGLKGVLKPHKSKSLPAINIKELPELLATLEDYNAPEIEKLAIKALLYTFVRTCELRKAKKTEFDFEKAIWTIPADRMKVKERGEHLVPLSKQAVQIFKRVFELTGDNEYVFPTKNFVKHPYMHENVINNLLDDMKYSERHCGHGFRRLASTTLNELGWYSPQVIDKQLAHEPKDKVSAAYNKAEYLPQRIILMQRWADYIELVVVEHKAEQIKYAA